MSSPTPLRDAGTLFRLHGRPLIVLTLLVYAPFFLIYKGVVATGALPADAADQLFGILGGLLAPLSNGAMVYLLRQADAGVPVSLGTSLKAAGQAFGRLLTSYIIISVIFLFWLFPMLPGFIYISYAKLPSSYIFFLGPLALPAVYIVSRYAFVDAVTVLEGLQAQPARFRSIDLAQDRRLRLAINALLLMLVPSALDFGADALAGLVQKEYGLSGLAMTVSVSVVLNVVATLLAIGPIVYFYAEYKIRLSTAMPRPHTVAVGGDAAKILAFKKPESGGLP